MENKKYDDLSPGVHHVRDVIPRVLGKIVRRCMKTGLVERYCRSLLSKETIQQLFNRHDRLKGA